MPYSAIAESQRRLIAGLQSFRSDAYPKREQAYKKVMKEGQKPHALFITCADSRIDPELLTSSGPGEIFVTRNIGNLVPAYGDVSGGVSPVIEYAVLALNVVQIVVCGHTGCGAMAGLLHPEKLGTMPAVKSWLGHGETALTVTRAKNPGAGEDQALARLIEENVLLQLNHLRTHPCVAGRIAQGDLAVSGWVYDIENGMVRIFDGKKFVPFDQLPSPAILAEGAIG